MIRPARGSDPGASPKLPGYAVLLANAGTVPQLTSGSEPPDGFTIATNGLLYVWGNFNELMTDAFLVNINELEYNDAKKGESQFKALITDPNITINPKGHSGSWQKAKN